MLIRNTPSNVLFFFPSLNDQIAQIHKQKGLIPEPIEPMVKTVVVAPPPPPVAVAPPPQQPPPPQQMRPPMPMPPMMMSVPVRPMLVPQPMFMPPTPQGQSGCCCSQLPTLYMSSFKSCSYKSLPVTLTCTA